MKKVKIPNQKQAPQQLNWDKPQWVINETHGIIVLTTGEHNSPYFTGTCLPCEEYPEGCISKKWTKGFFQPITFDIPFTISNELTH